MGRISPGPTRWPPGAERRLVPAKSNLKPQTSVCCVACAASWASRLLFTGVPARCVVLRVRRPGPPGSCSPVRPLGVLCCVCGVLGLLAPVHRCARSVCCVAVWGAAAGRSLVHPDGGYRSRQGLGTLRAHTRPSGWRLFVAGRGWVPSGRALVPPDGGCSLPAGVGYPPGAHSSIRTAAGVRVLALCGRVGRASLPGALWCASPFPLAALSFCFAWPPPGWGCPPSLAALAVPRCLGAVLWLFFSASRRLPLRALARRLCLLLGRWLLFGGFSPHPLPFCDSVFSSLLLGVVFFFFFFPFFSCAPPLSPAFSGFRPRVPWASALCVVCFVGLPPLGSPCASFVLSAWLVLAPLRLLPPPPFLSRGFRRCRSVLCAVCCVVLCVPRCGAVPCCARWVLLLVPPCLALPVALGPCALRRCVLRCSPVLCVFCRGAGVRAVVGRSALCCVCPGVLCCAFSVLSALCGAVLRCAGALALCCSCGARCCWRLVLWCAAVRCWVWWPVVVCWWRVSVSLSGRVVCFPVVCCGALLSCVVFCGAVLSRGAVLLCSAVVLRCCWGVLCPPVGCHAVLCCAVGWLCCFLPGGGVCVLWCSFPRAVRSLSSPLCALRCLVVLAVVPCFPVSCAVALCCRVVLCCRALLSFCGAVCVCFALLRPVVRRQCRLRCRGVSLGVLRCGGAALVCRGVLLCCALSCGVLRPVPCPAVPCCPAVLCWFVCCVGVVVPT